MGIFLQPEVGSTILAVNLIMLGINEEALQTIAIYRVKYFTLPRTI